MDKVVYGFPVVTADSVFNVLERLGIKPWAQTTPPVRLEEYLKRDLTAEQRRELKFVPASEAVFLQDHKGRPFTGFRGVGKNWVTTFALLPNPDAPRDELIAVAGEWKHGAEAITLAPPSGVLAHSDYNSMNPFEACARREFEEETGIELVKVDPLCGQGIPISARQMTTRFFPFLGEVREPIVPQPSKLDRTEALKTVLIPLSEWLKLIRAGQVLEDCAISITYLALEHLGRLRVT